jgi:phosphopantothenoylcysteine decarboxylase/phosphopantothenate--cysteine ligase
LVIERFDSPLKKANALKGKKVLITAGPTWVAIDSVRVISNIATGQTGILLAEEFSRLKAKVTLFLGPSGNHGPVKGVKLIRFCFFEELRKLIKRELLSENYDFIIHSAAVADFRPEVTIKGKLSSDKKQELKLVPLPKIIREIRRFSPRSKLVMFKLEPHLALKGLLISSRKAMSKAKADLIVGNSLRPYRCFLMDKKGATIKIRNRKELAEKLVKVLAYSL